MKRKELKEQGQLVADMDKQIKGIIVEANDWIDNIPATATLEDCIAKRQWFIECCCPALDNFQPHLKSEDDENDENVEELIFEQMKILVNAVFTAKNALVEFVHVLSANEFRILNEAVPGASIVIDNYSPELLPDMPMLESKLSDLNSATANVEQWKQAQQVFDEQQQQQQQQQTQHYLESDGASFVSSEYNQPEQFDDQQNARDYDYQQQQQYDQQHVYDQHQLNQQQQYQQQEHNQNR
jgi:hypothetical protein